MASIFEGIQFESPLDAQNRLRQQLMTQMQSGNSRQRAGLAVGTALANAINRFRTGEKGQGFFNRLRTGDADPQITEARQAQEVLGKVQQQANTQLEAGADPTTVRIQAMQQAAAEFAKLGRGDLAA